MNYYYDIVLNFLEDNYQFYEVDKYDCYEYIKKIPIYHISTNTYKNFIKYNFRVSDEFLKELENNTITSNCILKYAALFADKNNVIALEFDDSGLVIDRSPLTIKDELNVLDIIYTMDIVDINYEIISTCNIRKITRQEESIRRLIETEIDKLYVENNLSKLKFLYLEWFGKIENDKEIIYSAIKNKLLTKLGNLEEKIYNLIKISYNNV